MKVIVGYPPTNSPKGLALLSQNRQFQWFSHETRIFPVVLAGAATMAQQAGHQVIWKDTIAENIYKLIEDNVKVFLRKFKNNRII